MFSSSTINIEDKEALSKVDIRQAVWKHFQDNGLANFPHSVFRRIPNFKGANEASIKLAELDCFKNAKSIKVNLDKPQGDVRYLTLESGKTLLVPTPGLRTGLFNCMTNESAGENTPENLKLLSQNDGMKRFSKSLELDDEAKVDLIVVGSVAVSKSGHRIGKGEGFVDLEYGMMRQMNCVNEKTLIVTTVHDCQVFDVLPDRLFASHDVPVDVIVTPTQVINVTGKKPSRPSGILWKLLKADKFLRVAILRRLWQKEKDAGGDVSLATEDPVPSEEAIAEYWKNLEAEREATREARTKRVRSVRGGRRGMRRGGRGRGRGRRGGGGGYSEGDEGEEEPEFDEDGKKIQVTVNMNKRNRIVRRTVHPANQVDRDGEEGEEVNGEGGMARRGRGRGRGAARRGRNFFRGPPPFSIFLGNVPANSRTREIKEAVRDVITEKAQGVDIQRRTQAGYAFLRFNRLQVEEADDLVNALQGLKVLDQEVVVERARDRTPRGDGKMNGEGEEGEEDYGGYRGGRGGRRGGKRYRGARRGRGAGYGGDSRRRTRDEEGEEGEDGEWQQSPGAGWGDQRGESAEGGEEEGEQFHEAKE